VSLTSVTWFGELKYVDGWTNVWMGPPAMHLFYILSRKECMEVLIEDSVFVNKMYFFNCACFL
jgi:hypothetical protein